MLPPPIRQHTQPQPKPMPPMQFQQISSPPHSAATRPSNSNYAPFPFLKPTSLVPAAPGPFKPTDTIRVSVIPPPAPEQATALSEVDKRLLSWKDDVVKRSAAAMTSKMSPPRKRPMLESPRAEAEERHRLQQQNAELQFRIQNVEGERYSKAPDVAADAALKSRQRALQSHHVHQQEATANHRVMAQPQQQQQQPANLHLPGMREFPNHPHVPSEMQLPPLKSQVPASAFQSPMPTYSAHARPQRAPPLKPVPKMQTLPSQSPPTPAPKLSPALAPASPKVQPQLPGTQQRATAGDPLPVLTTTEMRRLVSSLLELCIYD